jgi:undecaprenyl-diphosphatase
MTGWLNSLLQQVVDFAGSSPTMVGLILAIAAAAEAIIVVGALFPGEAMVLAVAAAAGAAGLPLIPLVLWTTAGAIIGDGVSFWIGHSYGETIANWSYLKKRPALLSTGERFIEGHGVKSIITARFLPGLRAIVPVAAGVLRMPPVQFYAANVVSALLWALTHVLPAAGLGVAFNTLGAVSGRLTGLVAITLVSLFVVVWLISLVTRFIGPWLLTGYASLIGALGRLPWPAAQRLAGWLDPQHPHLPGLAFWAAFLLLVTVVPLALLERIAGGDLVVRADGAINQFMQSLRTEWGDELMVTVTTFSDTMPLAAMAFTMVVILALEGARLAAAWAAATIFAAAVFVPLIQLVPHSPRAFELRSPAAIYGFHGDHTTIATVVFSVFAVLVARKLPLAAKLSIYTVAVLWIGLVGLSQVYLSAYWPSDIIAGLIFGAALIAVFAMLTNHCDEKAFSRVGLAVGVLTVFLVAGGWNSVRMHEAYATHYQLRERVAQIGEQYWLNGGWRDFPGSRVDIKGAEKEEFQLQWAGPMPPLDSWLGANGWQQTKLFGWRDGLAFLLPRTTLDELAPLPRLHNGKLPVAVYVLDRQLASGLAPDQRLVLRFWSAAAEISDNGDEPKLELLLGALRRERLSHPFGMGTVLQPEPAVPADVAVLTAALARAKGLDVRHPQGAEPPALVYPKRNGR